MSNLSELLPAGAGAKSASFVASGTLGSGVTVALKTDGTVEAVGTTAVPDSAGTAVNFDAQGNFYTSMAYSEDAQQIIISYRASTGYGTAVVGTVSGTSISFGTPVVFFSGSTSFTTTTYDPSTQKVVIGYHNASNQSAYAIVGTISGSSISFGSASSITSVYGYQLSSTYDTNAQKVVIAFTDATSSDFGKAVVCTISGTSISFGAATTFNNFTETKSIIYDAAAQKVVIFYTNSGSSSYGTAIVGTVSGTSISFGTPVVFQSSGVSYTSGSYDPNSQKVIVGYKRTNLGGAAAVVGTVSGTSISFGTPVVFETKNVDYISNTYDLNAQKVVISFRDEFGTPTSEYGYAIVGTVSGTSISFGTASVFFTSAVQWIASVYDTAANKVAIAFDNNIFQGPGKAVVWTTGYTATNSADFIGITDQAIADTATGAVIVQGGVSEKLSGLTAGADYYVQADGVLASADGIPYGISGATYTQNFSVSSQDSSPRGIAFNTDGTKMFVTGSAGVDINEYALTTGFDISTASYSQNFSVISQTTSPRGVAFNTDGTKMFVVGQVGSAVYEYTLSSVFDLSTASYSQSFSLSSQETGAQDLSFNSDGTKMFVVGTTGQDVNEYTLSTGFNVSTASYSQNFSVSSEDAIPTGITFNTDGTRMFITGQTNDKVFEYTLTTGFDVSTASYSSINFSVLSEESNPLGLVFSANGIKMFITGTSGDDVNEYSTTPASTTVPAGRALSTTSILLEG